MSFFFDMSPIEEVVRALKGIKPPTPVVPVSVSFTPPPAPRSTRIVVDDLGVPADRRCQNVHRRFWSGVKW